MKQQHSPVSAQVSDRDISNVEARNSMQQYPGKNMGGGRTTSNAVTVEIGNCPAMGKRSRVAEIRSPSKTKLWPDLISNFILKILSHNIN